MLGDEKLVEQHPRLHEVVAIFEARVGWSVGAMLYQHNMISPEPLIQQAQIPLYHPIGANLYSPSRELPRTTLIDRPPGKVCTFCGATDWRLHATGAIQATHILLLSSC